MVEFLCNRSSLKSPIIKQLLESERRAQLNRTRSRSSTSNDLESTLSNGAITGPQTNSGDNIEPRRPNRRQNHRQYKSGRERSSLEDQLDSLINS
ncbi:Uncharacterised protein g3858 [Pycnogonum litorale]